VSGGKVPRGEGPEKILYRGILEVGLRPEVKNVDLGPNQLGGNTGPWGIWGKEGRMGLAKKKKKKRGSCTVLGSNPIKPTETGTRGWREDRKVSGGALGHSSDRQYKEREKIAVA